MHGVLSKQAVADLNLILAAVDDTKPGTRMSRNSALESWIERVGLTAIASIRLKRAAIPVRAILFDKSLDTNWALGWHQDRTIAVAGKNEVIGFGPWSRKAGIDHVEPPFEIIEAMLTLRVHLDPVDAKNSPLLIVPGSHRLGKIRKPELSAVVDRCGIIACLADQGDVWIYRTSIVHASAASQVKARRRVLQIDFSGDQLPPPLKWQGIGETRAHPARGARVRPARRPAFR